MRRLALAVCVLALPACGGGKSDDQQARDAAETYVARLGKRDGEGACEQMTRGLRRQFVDAVIRTNAQFRGNGCGPIMRAALNTIPDAQLKQFAGAKIENVRLDGDKGTFRYTLGTIRVGGRVAKEDGDWRVSCCVPGAG